jgi:hypothetical protein
LLNSFGGPKTYRQTLSNSAKISVASQLLLNALLAADVENQITSQLGKGGMGKV